MPDENAVTTIEVPPSYVQAAVGSVDEEARTVELVFSTGVAFVRYDWMRGQRYNLKLSLDSKHVRLARLNNGAPLLNAHSSYDLSKQVGVVVDKSAVVDGKEARCTVRFSKREEVEPIWQDVKDRIIRNVSVGTTIHKFEERQGANEDIPTRTAVDWEPFEVSLVPIGADDGAKVKASERITTNPCVVVTHVEEVEMPAEHTEGVVSRLRAQFNTLLDKFQTDDAEAAATPPGGASAAPVSDPPKTAADAKTVLRMCREGDCSAIAESLIEAEATVADVEAAVKRAKEITELCAAAEMPELAGSYIGSSISPDVVRGQLATYAAKADGGEISGHLDPGGNAPQKAHIDVNAIYAERNKAHRATQQEK